jgi:hypothetical protein
MQYSHARELNFINWFEEVKLIEMHVEILNGVVCRVCGAPMGKILDENAHNELL